MPAGPAEAAGELQRQQQQVEQLRERFGEADARSLVASARLIELLVAHGDVTSGAAVFDRIVGLDLRTSPALSGGKPPIELVRMLAGLGELEAARRLLALGVAKSRGFLEEGNPFLLEADRALERLSLVSGRTAAEAVSADDGTRSEAEFLDGFWSGAAEPPLLAHQWASGMGGHDHFDVMLEIDARSALETAERLRATSALDLSLLTRVRRFAGRSTVPRLPGEPYFRAEEDAERRERNEAELAVLDDQLQAVTRALDRIATADLRFESLRWERSRLQTKRTALLNDLWNSIEEVYVPTTAAAFQAALDPGTAALYYMVADDHTDLLVTTAAAGPTRHRFSLGSRELLAELRALTEEVRRASVRGVMPVSDGSSAVPRNGSEVARRLFDALLAPAESDFASADRLLIVADGPLHRLPFAALERETAEGERQRLLEWKPIHFAPSAAIYREVVARRRAREPRDDRILLAFGDPIYQGENGADPLSPWAVRSLALRGSSFRLEPLPGTRREVLEVGDLFRSHHATVRVLLGEKASEVHAKASAGDATHLHFAVHGVVDGEQPEHSFLALSVPPLREQRGENGMLEAWEIVDALSNEAELVTLSACETAIGLERSGEGPVSLSRAFFAAGARSVLATLWKVDDAATADLMIRFYRHLLSGSSKDEALRAAQLDVLRDGSHRTRSAPYYWAGFQISGDFR
jgi:CHAT domain-containing protein